MMEQCDAAHGLCQSPFQPPPGEPLFKYKASCVHQNIMLATVFTDCKAGCSVAFCMVLTQKKIAI